MRPPVHPSSSHPIVKCLGLGLPTIGTENTGRIKSSAESARCGAPKARRSRRCRRRWGGVSGVVFPSPVEIGLVRHSAVVRDHLICSRSVTGGVSLHSHSPDLPTSSAPTAPRSSCLRRSTPRAFSAWFYASLIFSADCWRP